MPTINLREHYPDAHPEDFFVEVSEEVHQALIRHPLICLSKLPLSLM